MLKVLSAAALVALAFAVPTASGHVPERTTEATTGVSVPIVMSSNVRIAGSFPETTAISGEFAKTGDYFYVSSADSISVFDTSVPAQPKLLGTIGNLVFENEAMTYGERKVDGQLQRFVLVGNDLYDVAVDPHNGPTRGRVGGGQVLVIDVTDPRDPHVRSTTPGSSSAPGVVTTSTHTVQCLTTSCEFAYTAGDGGEFSIVDLRDLDNPRQLRTAPSAAAAPNPVFASGSGHYWDVDSAGIAWHTGSGGAAAFDISDPVNPRPLNTTDENGTASPWNDFIHHNSQRPNASKFAAGTAPSLSNGNVLLVTEEDYLNDGDEVVCEKAGTFQTWHVPEMTPGAASIRPLDLINPVALGQGLSTPVGGFCSAHWFDYHQSGIIAEAYYQQGLRFIDVRDPQDLKPYAYVTGGASEVWDAYFVPARNRNGVATGKKTNVVYSVDLVRGLDVYVVDLPSKDLSGDTTQLPVPLP
jgi:hypothetical protein